MKLETAKSLLTLAQIPILGVWELPNGYLPDCVEYYQARKESPWWLIKTPYGNLVIGWRKRVIQIDWSDFKFRGKVTKDDTTSEDSFVHAWSEIKAAEYLSNLQKLISESEPEKPRLRCR